MNRKSTESKLNKISRRDLLVIAGAVLLIASIYLLASYFTNSIGFLWMILDTSNLCAQFSLAWRMGISPRLPSAGSTSPLWSALLAIGFSWVFHHISGHTFLACFRSSLWQFFANGLSANSLIHTLRASPGSEFLSRLNGISFGLGCLVWKLCFTD